MSAIAKGDGSWGKNKRAIKQGRKTNELQQLKHVCEHNCLFKTLHLYLMRQVTLFDKAIATNETIKGTILF